VAVARSVHARPHERGKSTPRPGDRRSDVADAGTVAESRNPQFKVGDKVVGYLGWQEYGVSDGSGIYKVDTRVIPLRPTSPVGMPRDGLVRTEEDHRTEGGETILVSRHGAVGSVVGQLAKLAGCRPSASPAGGECSYAWCSSVRRLHRLQVQDVNRALKDAAPQASMATSKTSVHHHGRGAAAHERVGASRM